MDRFIETSANTTLSIYGNLKSNMDRFIVGKCLQ